MGTHSIGIALGGGASRGLAHIQVLHGLDELGVKPARMAGTSIGALLGVAYAAGMSAKEIEEHAREVLSTRLSAARRAFSSGRGGVLDLINFNLISSPLLDGTQLVKLVMPPSFPEDLGELNIPFTVVTTNLHTMSEVALDSGSVVFAIASSIAIPGIISAPPGGQVLIDGVCVNPVPLSHVQDGCDIIMGVNVIGRPIERSTRQVRTPELIIGAMQIQQHTIARLEREKNRCDLWIEPNVSHFKVHEFFRLDEIMRDNQGVRDEVKRQIEKAIEKREKRVS
jgi:NTE family protein